MISALQCVPASTVSRTLLAPHIAPHRFARTSHCHALTCNSFPCLYALYLCSNATAGLLVSTTRTLPIVAGVVVGVVVTFMYHSQTVATSRSTTTSFMVAPAGGSSGGGSIGSIQTGTSALSEGEAGPQAQHHAWFDPVSLVTALQAHGAADAIVEAVAAEVLLVGALSARQLNDVMARHLPGTSSVQRMQLRQTVQQLDDVAASHDTKASGHEVAPGVDVQAWVAQQQVAPPPTREQQAAPTPALKCGWRFLQYHVSPVEAAWKQNIAYNQENVVSATKAFRDDAKRWTAYSAGLEQLQALPCDSQWTVELPPHPSTSQALYNVLSAFEYTWVCEGGQSVAGPANVFVPIEPLAGPLRHPDFCIENDQVRRTTCCPALPVAHAALLSVGLVLNCIYNSRSQIPNLIRRDYIVMDRWATVHAGAPWRSVAAGVSSQEMGVVSQQPAARTTLLFDVGASTWREGSGGPSQPYFVDWLQKHCLTIRGIFAWEAVHTSPSVVFDQLPGRL